MIAARRATLAVLLGIAAASCGSSSAPGTDGPAGEVGGGNAEGGARDGAADGAADGAHDGGIDGPRDAPVDGACPPEALTWGPCEKSGAECVAQVSPNGGFTKYYCVSCGSPLPMPDANVPSGSRWQTILSCPP